MRRGEAKAAVTNQIWPQRKKLPLFRMGADLASVLRWKMKVKGSYLKHPGRQCPSLNEGLKNKLRTKTVSKGYIYHVHNALRSQGHIVFLYNFTWVWWPAMDLKGVILQSQFHNTVLNLEIPIKPTMHTRALLSFPFLSHMESEIIPAGHGFLFEKKVAWLLSRCQVYLIFSPLIELASSWLILSNLLKWGVGGGCARNPK